MGWVGAKPIGSPTAGCGAQGEFRQGSAGAGQRRERAKAGGCRLLAVIRGLDSACRIACTGAPSGDAAPSEPRRRERVRARRDQPGDTGHGSDNGLRQRCGGRQQRRRNYAVAERDSHADQERNSRSSTGRPNPASPTFGHISACPARLALPSTWNARDALGELNAHQLCRQRRLS